METVASHPTELTLEQGQWFRFNPKASLLITSGMILSLFLSFKYSFYYLILLGVMIIINKIYWWFIERRFQKGDYNVGKVVSTSPMLVAVPTDLRKGYGGLFPVIKVIEIKFDKLGDTQLSIGDKIGTCGLYTNSNDDIPFWLGFDPVPVFYGNSDFAKQQKRAEASTTIEAWQDFEEQLNQLPKPFQRGLYKITTSTSSWHNYPEAQLKSS